MKRFLNSVKSSISVLDGEDPTDPAGPEYDPVHVAAILVGSLFALGTLYWLLWSLLVCGGGLFTKVGPLL